MCRTGGRRCPSHSDPEKIAERNAQRRAHNAERKGAPLTDAQYNHRVDYAYDKIKTEVELGHETHKLFAVETPTGELNWNDERTNIHDEIIQELLDSWENVPENGEALFMGGLGGAGKTTVLTKHANIDVNKYAILNPDDIKEILAEKGYIPTVKGLSPMEASPLVHEEASHIVQRLSEILTQRKKNLIYDITMSSRPSTLRKIERLKNNGYTVDAIFVDIPYEVSIKRSQSRHRAGINRLITEKEGYGGRLLPLEIIEKMHKMQPLQIFTDFCEEETFREWQLWDNGTDGKPAVLIEQN